MLLLLEQWKILSEIRDLMRKIFHRSIQDDPCFRILLIRSDPSSVKTFYPEELISSPIITKLPSFDQTAMKNFANLIQTGKSFVEALNSINFMFNIDPDNIRISGLSKQEIAPDNLIVLLYQAFAAMMIPPEQQDLTLFSSFIKCFNNSIKSSLLPEISAIFIEYTTIIFNIPNFYLPAATLNDIATHFVLNTSLDQSSCDLVTQLIGKVSELKEADSYKDILSTIMTLFTEKRPIIQDCNFMKVLGPLNEKLRDLEPVITSLVGRASNVTCSPDMIEYFISIPNLLLAKVCQTEIRITSEIYNNQSVLKEPDETRDEFDFPRYDDEEEQLKEYIHPELLSLVQHLNNMIEISAPLCAESIVRATSGTIMDSFQNPFFFDYVILILTLIPAIGQKTLLDPIHQSLLFSPIFNENLTSYSKYKVHPIVDIVRSAVFHYVAQSAPQELINFFLNNASNPFLFVESLAHILNFRFAMDYKLFTNPTFLSQLIAVIFVLRDPNINANDNDVQFASQTAFLFLFQLLDDPYISLDCFSDNAFSTAFISFMFEEDISAIVTDKFLNCITKFMEFPPSILSVMCTMFQSCAKRPGQDFLAEHIKVVGRWWNNFLKGSTTSITDITPILNSSLACIQSYPSIELLDAVLSMISYHIQHVKEFILSPNKAGNLLEAIQTIEGPDPSQDLITKFNNIIAKTTNLAVGSVYPIRIPSFIPILLFSFAQSDKLNSILENFTHLCKASRYNAIMCHEGLLDLILLRGLNGPVSFYDKIINFKIKCDEATDPVYLCLDSIMISKSSYPVFKAAFDLIAPRSDSTYHPAASAVIQAFGSILCNCNLAPDPIYEIGPTKEIGEMNNIPAKSISNGFAFIFWSKMDTAYFASTGDKVSFIEFHDASNRIFKVYLQHESINVSYQRDGYQTSYQLAKEVPKNTWDFYVIIAGHIGQKYRIRLMINDEMTSECEFPQITLDDKFKARVGTVENDKIKISPCQIGAYALISYPFVCANTSQFSMNGFNSMENVKLTFNNKTLNYPSSSASDFRAIFRKYSKVNDLLPIFMHLENAPPMLAEAALKLISNCKLSKSKNNTIAAIAVSEKTEKLYYKLTNKKFDHEYQSFRCSFTDMSAIIYMIMTNSSHLIDYSLYKTYYSLLDEIPDMEISNEIYQNIVFNLWVWILANDFDFSRVLTQWRTVLIRGQLSTMKTRSYFSSFLIQSFILMNTTQNKLLKKFTCPILLELAALQVNTYDINALFSVMYQVTDNELLHDYFAVLNYCGKNVQLFDKNMLLIFIDFKYQKNPQMFSDIIKFLNMIKTDAAFEIMCIVAHKFYMTSDCDINVNIFVSCIRALYHDIKLPGSIQPEKNVDIYPYWYVWPIISALWRPQNLMTLAIFIADTCMQSTKLTSNLSQIFEFVALIDAANIFNCSKIRNELIYLFVSHLSNTGEINDVTNVITIIFVYTFFRFSNTSFSHLMIDLMHQEIGSFVDDTFGLLAQNKIKTPGDFHMKKFFNFLKMDFTKYRMRYSNDCFTEKMRMQHIIEVLAMLIKKHDPQHILAQPLNKIIENDRTQLDVVLLSFEEKFEKALLNYQVGLRNQFMIVSKSTFPIATIFDNAVNVELTFLKNLLSFGETRLHIKSDLEIGTPAAPYSMLSCARIPSNYVSTNDNTNKSYQCKLSCGSITTGANVNITSKRFKITSWEMNISFNLQFPYIRFIVKKMDAFEIFTSNCDSIVLSFDINDIQSIDQLLVNLKLPVVRNPKTFVDLITEKWCHYEITNFELVLYVNLITEHTFSDFSYFPIFPLVIQPNQQEILPIEIIDYFPNKWPVYTREMKKIYLKEFSVEEFLQTAQQQGICLPAQFFFYTSPFYEQAKLPQWAKTPIEFVSIHRKAFNDYKVSTQLPMWIEAQFGYSVPYISAKPSLEYSTSVQTIQASDISYAGNVTRYIFYAISKTGLLTLFINENEKSITRTLQLSLSNNLEIVANNLVIIIFDIDKQKLFKINKDLQYNEYEVVESFTSIILTLDRVYTVIENTVLSYSTIDEFPTTRHEFMHEIDSISKVIASYGYDALMCISIQAKVSRVSLSRQVKVSSFMIPFGDIRNILITEKWGFFVMEIAGEILVFTLFGDLVKRLSIPNPVSMWTTLHDLEGNDYVAFVDEKRVFYIFDCICGRLHQVQRIDKNPVLVYHQRDKRSLNIIAEDGNVYVFTNLPTLLAA